MNGDDTITRVEIAVRHHFIDRDGVPLHVAVMGEGPLIVFLHGFPDHWLSWHAQMAAFADRYTVAALDLRGFNLSGQPIDAAAYAIPELVADVGAVIEACGADKAVLVGHDWGGWLAWTFAMHRSDRLRALAIVNMPHPWAIARDLAQSEAQRAASAYVRAFQQQGAEAHISKDRLGRWVTDPAFRARHDLAMARTNLEATLNYYRVHFPSPPYSARTDAPPPVRVPTLAVHGLADPYALGEGLNDLWRWIDAPLTIEAWPSVGHFVQHEEPRRLTTTLAGFLDRLEQ